MSAIRGLTQIQSTAKKLEENVATALKVIQAQQMVIQNLKQTVGSELNELELLVDQSYQTAVEQMEAIQHSQHLLGVSRRNLISVILDYNSHDQDEPHYAELNLIGHEPVDDLVLGRWPGVICLIWTITQIIIMFCF